MLRLIVLLIASAVLSVNAQFANRCPSSPVLTDFDATRYVGKWYEVERFSAGFEDNLKCVFAQYTLVNSSYIAVQNNGFNPFVNQLNTINGYAFVPNVNNPNHLTVVLRVPVPGLFIETTGKYDVWATDYENYSLVYSCQMVPPSNTKKENVFILSRSKTLSPSVLSSLKDMLSNAGFNTNLLEVTPQDC